MIMLHETVTEIRDVPALVHCSSSIELKGGELLCVWYEGPYETSSHTVLRFARRSSLDTEPGEWSSAETLLGIAGVPLGNPVLWRDPAGRVRLLFSMLISESWTESILLEMHSEDEGVTWSPPYLFYGRKGFMPKTRPCVLPTGSVVVPLYHEAEFCPYMLVMGDRQPPFNAGLVGETMARGKVIQPALVKLSDDSILLLGRSRTGWVSRSMSYNGGNSWAICSDTGIPNPNSAIDLVHGGPNAEHAGDTLYLVGNFDHRSRSELSVLVSFDSGVRWTRRVTLVEGDGEYSYPSAIMTRGGALWITYTEDRFRIRGVRMESGQLLREAIPVEFRCAPGGAL